MQETDCINDKNILNTTLPKGNSGKLNHKLWRDSTGRYELVKTKSPTVCLGNNPSLSTLLHKLK